MHRQVILRHAKNAPTIHKIDTVLTRRKYVPTVHNTLQKNCQSPKLRPTVTGRDNYHCRVAIKTNRKHTIHV